MTSLVVVPAAAARPASSGTDDGDVVYEFACRRVLPRFDDRKCIKHAILSPRVLKRVNRVLHATKRWVPLWYALGLVCGSIVLFVPSVTIIPRTCRWIGITSLVLAIPNHTSAFLALHFDMTLLVCRTFEFWYMTLLNAGATTLLYMALRDGRALAVVSASLAFQLAFCIDAIFRAPRVAISVTALGAVANIVFIVSMGFHILPNVNRVVLVTLHDRSLTSDDLITNALATVSVLLTRNAFRKYQSIKSAVSVGPSTTNAIGTCITYRCCLELREKKTPTPEHEALSVPQVEPRGNPLRTASSNVHAAGPTFIQLRFVSSGKAFNARDLIIPRWLTTLSLQPWSWWTQLMFWLVGAISLVALVAFHLLERLSPDGWRSYRTAISMVVFLFTSAFCGVYLAHCQRELLLRELGRSFDYLFVATQALCAHLCVCDLYDWDLRCLNVAATWFWTHWVLSLDAVTPVMKRKLGFHKYGAAIVGFVLLFQQLLLITTLLSRTGFADTLQQRLLFTLRLGERTLDVSVVSVLLGRIFVTWLWSVRIAWRLFDRQESELLVLQGQLQYDVDVRTRKPTLAVPLQLLPVPDR